MIVPEIHERTGARFFRCRNDFLFLLVEMNAEFFDRDDMGVREFRASHRKRLVLDRDRLDPVGLVLPGDSEESAARSIHIAAGETENLRETQEIGELRCGTSTRAT